MGKESESIHIYDQPSRDALPAPKRQGKMRILPGAIAMGLGIVGVYHAEELDKCLPEIELPSDPAFYMVMAFMLGLYGVFGGFRR